MRITRRDLLTSAAASTLAAPALAQGAVGRVVVVGGGFGGATAARFLKSIEPKLSVTLVEANAATWQPSALLDAVLLDAPCSATGTIRRHPDVAHLKRPRDVTALTAQQDQLIDAAIRMLKPGGRLIYAVCSLQPEEGEARLEAALARNPGLIRPAPFRPEDLPGLTEAITIRGDLRTTPAMWAERGGMDGFFAGRLVRV